MSVSMLVCRLAELRDQPFGALHHWESLDFDTKEQIYVARAHMHPCPCASSPHSLVPAATHADVLLNSIPGRSRYCLSLRASRVWLSGDLKLATRVPPNPRAFLGRGRSRGGTTARAKRRMDNSGRWWWIGSGGAHRGARGRHCTCGRWRHDHVPSRQTPAGCVQLATGPRRDERTRAHARIYAAHVTLVAPSLLARHPCSHTNTAHCRARNARAARLIAARVS